MKKTKKLSLNRETLRRLVDSQVANAAGGILKTQLCTTDAPPCATYKPIGCGGQTNKHIWC